MTGKQNNLGPLTFGLDIGIASVGWAVLGENRIIDLGVRCFDAAEDKKGKPNNQTRRGARVARNRNKMRRWRLKRLVRLFRDVGLLSNDEIKQLFAATRPKSEMQPLSPWALRAAALTRKLSPQEWAQVIYYLVKHRGFKFFSNTEDPRNSDANDEPVSSSKSAEQKELEGLRDGLLYTAHLLKKYPQFKTIGDAAYHIANAEKISDDNYRDKDGNPLETRDCIEFKESFHNKGKSYRHAFHRDDLLNELTSLFEVQKHFGNPYIELALPEQTDRLREVQISSETRQVKATFKDQVITLLEMQHPPIYTSQMDALIGKCELEKNELRAAKNTFSNERATWLQTINNLRIKRNGKEEPLTPDERAVLLNLPYTQSKVTFKQAREALRTSLGFPAHWREASFTRVTYRNKRKDDGSWLNVIGTDGTKVTLGKYGQETTRKKANKELKNRLETGTMTYAELRQLFQLRDSEVFERVRNETEIVPLTLEDNYTIPDGKKTFVKLLPAKSKKALTLKGRAMHAFTNLSNENPSATLADLRLAIEQAERLEAGWQFEYSRKDSESVRPENETTTQVPIEYEEAQKAEDETLIELKGWHAFKRALEVSQPDWWANLQVAYINPQSDAGQVAARQLDAIAELLTKAQTDADVGKGLSALALTESQIVALEKIRFKQYRNLSLIALRKVLPGLEAGKSRTEACKDAGYKTVTHQRTKHLPPLETYLYERIRHGKKTKYTELRYKDLTNPVVARAFNQARLVLNALIDRYDSPAYVHVELARDLAKPKDKRDAETKRQNENRNKKESIRNNFIATYQIGEPSSTQLLKERLYNEQGCKSIYSLEKLDLARILDDPHYAELDHIWPRSRTFDNSMENLVLVLANENQDKGNRIPYDFIKEKYGEEHWRRVNAHVLGCKGISGNKQRRLLALELDADEFSARNLVDTRYATRLFARMVRDHLLFEGQVEDNIEDIDPSESGKARLEKFHKSRVRTPQGGLTAFLRRSWLGIIKDREASDKHHALDACIIAASTPEFIHRVNSWFANEEKIPNRFKKNSDGTYTDKFNGSGEIISKQEARERGLYLPPPWDNFRNEFLQKYESVFVTRAIRKKRNVELHDSNPMSLRNYPVSLLELTLDMLDENLLPPNLPETRLQLIRAIKQKLISCDGDAKIAFQNGFQTTNAKGHANTTHTIPLPLISLPEDYLSKKRRQLASIGSTENFKDTAKKNISLNNLSLKMLSEKELGTTFYHRNQRMVEALKVQLTKYDDDAEKAFAEPFYPFGIDRPRIKSIQLPASRSSGIFVRGGVANLGDALYTEMYKHEGCYWFRARYKTTQENTFGLPVMPKGAQHICNLNKNDLVRIKHPSLAGCYRESSRHKDSFGNTLIEVEALFDDGIFEGYWNYFEPSNDRPVVQLHDGSAFFLLDAGKSLDRESLTLIAKPKEKKKGKSKKDEPEEFEYFEFSNTPQETPSLKFSLVRDIKRIVGDASSIEKITVGILGIPQEESD